MTNLPLGRLLTGGAAPPTGEHHQELVRFGPVRVEQILTGRLDAPLDFDQDHDEWVVVLAGGATLDVSGRSLELTAGDWVLLRARVPHRLVSAEPGTSWLAVHSAP